MKETTDSVKFRREKGPPERMLCRGEVANGYNIPLRYLEIAACKGGGPPFVKIGRLVRYRVADLEEWIAKNRYESTSQIARRDGGSK